MKKKKAIQVNTVNCLDVAADGCVRLSNPYCNFPI